MAQYHSYFNERKGQRLKKLAEYLIFYNTERPNKSLGLKSPMDYLIEKVGMSQRYVTYTRPLQI